MPGRTGKACAPARARGDGWKDHQPRCYEPVPLRRRCPATELHGEILASCGFPTPIDSATNTVGLAIRLYGNGADAAAIDLANSTLYVSCYRSGRVVPINTSTNPGSPVHVIPALQGIEVGPDGNVYATDSSHNTISPIEDATGTAEALPSGRRLWQRVAAGEFRLTCGFVYRATTHRRVNADQRAGEDRHALVQGLPVVK